MARVTVEDCILKIPNRFELVLLAGQRARDLSAGAEETLDRDNDKNPVVALREIAEETVDFGALEETIIRSLQKRIEIDEPEEEEMDLLAIQQEITGTTEELGTQEELAKNSPEDEATDEATDEAKVEEAPDSTETEPAADKTPEDADTDDIKESKD